MTDKEISVLTRRCVRESQELLQELGQEKHAELIEDAGNAFCLARCLYLAEGLAKKPEEAIDLAVELVAVRAFNAGRNYAGEGKAVNG